MTHTTKSEFGVFGCVVLVIVLVTDFKDIQIHRDRAAHWWSYELLNAIKYDESNTFSLKMGVNKLEHNL